MDQTHDSRVKWVTIFRWITASDPLTHYKKSTQ